MQTSETEQAWSAAKYCEKKQHGQEDWGAEERKENGQAQLLWNTERLLFKQYLHEKDSSLHTKKILRKNNFLYKYNYHDEISEIWRKYKEFLENISQWEVAQIKSNGNEENTGLISEKSYNAK